MILKIKSTIENNIFSLVQISLGVALIFGFQPKPWHLFTLGVYWLVYGVSVVFHNWSNEISKKAGMEFEQEID